jgi:hypothetical protein
MTNSIINYFIKINFGFNKYVHYVGFPISSRFAKHETEIALICWLEKQKILFSLCIW